jgi:integrase
MPKGAVNIEVFNDRLRLASSWRGKRFWLYIGLPDSIANRKAASMKASQIELDMASGNFDPSLTKYKPQKQESISVSDLFDQFVEYKRRKIEPATLAKYLGLQKHVSVFFNNKTTISVSESVAENFRHWLLSDRSLESVTVRERIVMMNASWEWGQKKKLVTENPWKEVKVSVGPSQRPGPFTLAEIGSILTEILYRSGVFLNVVVQLTPGGRRIQHPSLGSRRDWTKLARSFADRHTARSHKFVS